MAPEASVPLLQFPPLTPLGVTALLLFAALLVAETAVRLLRLPRIAALVVAGAVAGWVRSHASAAASMPVPGELLEALAVVLLFEVGQRVPLAWIRRNPWLLAASVGETGAAFLAILGVLSAGFGRPTVECLYVAAICMAASPIVVLSVTKDLGARGQVSERALLLSTLSSVYAALAMQFLVTGTRAAAHAQIYITLQPLLQLAGSFLLGAIAAGVLRTFAWLTGAGGAVLTIGMLCTCMLLYACAAPLGMSSVMAALFFGLAVRVTDRNHRLLSHQTLETGSVLGLAYFILLGASFPFTGSGQVAWIAAAIVVARLFAKVGMNALLASPSALDPVKGAFVGLALSPLSSLALMFAAGIARQPGLEEAAQISSTVVLILAILGPVLTEVALRYTDQPTRRAP
jgi:hypothetical protein